MDASKTILELLLEMKDRPISKAGGTHRVYKFPPIDDLPSTSFGLRVYVPSKKELPKTLPQGVSGKLLSNIDCNAPKKSTWDQLSEGTSFQTTYYGPYGIPSQPLMGAKDLDLQIIPWIDGPSLRQLFSSTGDLTWPLLAGVAQKEYNELFIQLRNSLEEGKATDLQHQGNIMANVQATEKPVFHLIDVDQEKSKKAQKLNTPESLIRLFFPRLGEYKNYTQDQEVVLAHLVEGARQAGMGSVAQIQAFRRLKQDYVPREGRKSETTLTFSERLQTATILAKLGPYIPSQKEVSKRTTELPGILLGNTVRNLFDALQLASKQREKNSQR